GALSGRSGNDKVVEPTIGYPGNGRLESQGRQLLGLVGEALNLAQRVAWTGERREGHELPQGIAGYLWVGIDRAQRIDDQAMIGPGAALVQPLACPTDVVATSQDR